MDKTWARPTNISAGALAAVQLQFLMLMYSPVYMSFVCDSCILHTAGQQKDLCPVFIQYVNGWQLFHGGIYCKHKYSPQLQLSDK